MGNLNLSSPWVIFYRKVNELFKEDPEVKIVFDQDNNVLNLYVDNDEKAEALTKLLPTEKEFGNVVLKIRVVPANLENDASNLDLFKKAFKGNPVFVDAISTEGDLGFHADYLLFAKKVVQFYSDDLSDPHGATSTLYQELAKEVFGTETGVYFCTDLGGEPLSD